MFRTYVEKTPVMSAHLGIVMGGWGSRILQSFSCTGTVPLRNRPRCWAEIETRGDIFTAAPCSEGPFMTSGVASAQTLTYARAFRGYFGMNGLLGWLLRFSLNETHLGASVLGFVSMAGHKARSC